MKHMQVGLGVLAAGLIAFLILVRLADTDTGVDTETVRVAATIFPLYDMVREVAANTDTDVQLLLPPGASPHFFEFTPKQLAGLGGLDLVFAIGYGLDSWAAAVVDAFPAAKIVVADEGVALRETADPNDAVEAEQGDVLAPIDPHYWLSYTNAALLTANIADVLSNLDPVNADRYEQNAASYAQFLAGERTAALELIAGTQANKNLITLHDAWYYFADDLGLTIVGTFEPTAGEEPTPKALAELAALAKEHGVTAIFGEVELSTASVQNFAQDANLKVGFFDEHGGVEGRMSFAELMRFNVQSILIEAGGL